MAEETKFTDEELEELKHQFLIGIRRFDTRYELSLYYNYDYDEAAVNCCLWELTLSDLKKEETYTTSMRFTKKVFEEIPVTTLIGLFLTRLFLFEDFIKEIVNLMTVEEQKSLREAVEDKIKELDGDNQK